MKKLELNHMENINGGRWESLLCKVGFTAVGSLFGPIGGVTGAVVGNLLCYPTKAY